MLMRVRPNDKNVSSPSEVETSHAHNAISTEGNSTFRGHASSRIDDSRTRRFADLKIRSYVDDWRRDVSRTSGTIRGLTV